MRAPSKGAVPGASIRGGARSVSGRCGYTPVTTRPDKARSLAWLSSSRCEKIWARTRVVHIVTCGVRVASWCACTRRVQCGMWLVGCCLFKACVMRHAVLCRSTRCVVNRQSSRPVCREHGRESCFDFRLRTPRRCVSVWPPSRAWSRRSGKVNGPRATDEGERAAAATGRDGRRDDGLSESDAASPSGARRRRVVPACRRPAAVISDENSVTVGRGWPPVRPPSRRHASWGWASSTRVESALCVQAGNAIANTSQPKLDFGFRRVLFLYHLRLGIYFCTIYVVRIRSTLITGCPERRGTQPR